MNNAALRKLLGYLNLSSGAADPQFYRCVNEAYSTAVRGVGAATAWHVVRQQLEAELLIAAAEQAAGFESVEQAAAVIALLFDVVLPGYRKFHRDLLAHQSDESLFQPFFVAKVAQGVLRQEAPWTDKQRILDGTLAALNSFIGHRPVAVLRTSQKIEPYKHEWVCPIPLYLTDAGVADGRYHDLIAAAITVLRETPRAILEAAYFDPDRLAELALDPRAYDFDHPANKRPNYHFGQWDPHAIDNAGNYRRFVLQAVTLDALLERVEEDPAQRENRLREAAVVLAGTMLMAAGVSGSGPETHDSGTTLSQLMPRIAAYRDEFYRQRLAALEGEEGDRLRAEAVALRQPFGGARHDLNQRLARLRASQLQHVHLARLFAAMGNLDASSRQAQVVPVTSARMLSQISGQITVGQLALGRGNVPDAARHLADVDDLLKRAIRCGAVVDPWNILGFQGHFSLFPALENSVRDHRVDVLIHLAARTLGLGVHTAAEAAATGDRVTLSDVTTRLGALATWWDRFGTLDVSGVDSVSGRESVEAAAAVAGALAAWRDAGATGGDIAFWRQHVAQFQSPRAYALVIRTLLDKRDFVAAMGLLVQWLSESENMPLADNEYSFYALAERWLNTLLPPSGKPADAQAWSLCARFFDYLEANAGDYWAVPRLALAEGEASSAEADDDDANPYGAAYEGVTYLDTTNDGIEGATLSGGELASDYELDLEATRLRARLAFLRTLARLRTIGAVTLGAPQDQATDARIPARDSVAGQLGHAGECQRGLQALLISLHQFRIGEPTGDHTSLIEHDRRRRLKESLLADVANTAVDAAEAVRWMRAAVDDAVATDSSPSGAGQIATWESLCLPVLRGILAGNAAHVRAAFPALRHELEQQPILYVPLSRGGDPGQFLRTQSLKQLILDLLVVLPRLGMLAETSQLLTTAAAMEKHRPQGEKAITEFDRLFETGYRAMVEELIHASTTWNLDAGVGDAELVECLQAMTEPLLRLWLEHSRSVRLSVLERVSDSERFAALVNFVERYGHDLFTQRFLNLGSLRAILDAGAANYLRMLEQEPGPAQPLRLIEDLADEQQAPITRAAAAEHLQVVVEAIVENYSEYKDFNTTTTQSDHGELLYMLLDALRLKANYDRVCWNIRPIVWAHEALMRRGQDGTAEIWRRALADRTGEVADALLKQFEQLSQRYQMRLPSIAARLSERFVRPLAVDGLCALVPAAIKEIRRDGPGEAFARLELEINEFAEQPTGSGLEVPAWLAALEEEISQAHVPETEREPDSILARRVPRQRLSLDEVQRQLQSEEGRES